MAKGKGSGVLLADVCRVPVPRISDSTMKKGAASLSREYETAPVTALRSGFCGVAVGIAANGIIPVVGEDYRVFSRSFGQQKAFYEKIFILMELDDKAR